MNFLFYFFKDHFQTQKKIISTITKIFKIIKNKRKKIIFLDKKNEN